MKEFLDQVLFSLGSQSFQVSQIILLLFLSFAILFIYKLIVKFLLSKFEKDNSQQNSERKTLRRLLLILFLLGFGLVFIHVLKLEYALEFTDKFKPSVSLILEGLFVIQLMRLLDWVINHLYIERYYGSADDHVNRTKLNTARKTVHYIFYCLIAIFILKNFGLDYQISSPKIDDTKVPIMLSHVFVGFFILMLARLFIWVLTEIILRNFYKNKNIELGSQFAINQLVKYVLYVFAFVYALDVVGINMTLLLGGAAALLVGVGLGLQQTFNDFISGLVLLFERTVSVGDILEFGGTVGTVKKIGLRASIVETRGNVSIVVPNHLLVNETVHNWTHFTDKVRFDIAVGVAYGSDTAVVKKLLLQSVITNPNVLEYPSPIVRFENFGDSSLDFKLYFYSRNYIVIEDIKSDIRLEIDRLFREHKISIPFPQRDVNLRNL